MIPFDSKHPAGTVAVASRELLRYATFPISLSAVFVPQGTMLAWQTGQWVDFQMNRLVTMMRGEWIWFMGDDHSFDQDTLLRLLDRNVDVVVPLCSLRNPPFEAVCYVPNPDPAGRKYLAVPWEAMPRQGMFSEYNGVPVRCGTAGMLVRRDIFRKVLYPWFECGKTNPEAAGEDLWFCEKLIAAGGRIHVDSEVAIDHTGPMSVRPVRNRNGDLRIDLDMGNNVHLRFRAAPDGLEPDEDQETDEFNDCALPEEVDADYFDRWRVSTMAGELTYADQQRIGEVIAAAFPRQVHFTWPAIRGFLEKQPPDSRVLEVGGWKGDLAQKVFVAGLPIAFWLNVDLTPSVREDPACRAPWYNCVVPDAYFWHGDWKWYNANVMVLSHVIEHLRAVELEALIRAIPQSVEAIYVEAPIPDAGPVDWSGYLGTHILEWGWAEVLEAFGRQGFVMEQPFWGTVRTLRRAAVASTVSELPAGVIEDDGLG